MNEDKWLHSIKEKLSSHRVSSPQSLWEKIDSQLSASPIRIRHRRIYIAAAVASLLVIIALALFSPTQHNTNQELVATTSPAEESEQPVETPTVDNTILPQPNDIACHTTHHSSLTQEQEESNLLPCEKQDCSTSTLLVENRTNREETTTIHNNNNNSNDSTTKSEQPFVDTSKPLISYCLDKDSDYNEMLQEVTQEIKSTASPSILLAFEANTSYQQETITPFSFRCGEAEVAFNHKMPLNVKILLEKRFGKWSIGSGVSYTYLTADYEMSYNIRNGRQDLHYIGVPLYVGYEFARIKRLSFYTSVGGQIDINTSAIHSENSNSHAYPRIEDIEFRDKKPQFSTQLHVGAAVEIIPHLDFYIEPTLGYYFENGSKIHSTWHDQPWNVSISLGLRAGF